MFVALNHDTSFITLPALESVGFKAFSTSTTGAPPKRMVLLEFRPCVLNDVIIEGLPHRIA
jgi:hypothetical protein